MKDTTVFMKTYTFVGTLKARILIGLCVYVVLLSVTALTHNHDEHAHSEDACTACFYISQHVGTEINSTALIFPFLSSTTLPLYEDVFLPLRLTTNTRSRAPPVFSDNLTNSVS